MSGETLSPRLLVRRNAIGLAALITAWCAFSSLAGAWGNFPLNDDWAYALSVRRLVESGQLLPNGWVSTPLLTNIAWGSIFCIPFGFSFDALRLSTFVLSLIGITGCYALACATSRSRDFAILSALVLGSNPIYFALSHTFMTDVPFTAIAVLATLVLARDLEKRSLRNLALGTTLATAAVLSRQLGMCIPLAFAVVSLFQPRCDWQHRSRAFIPLVACVVSLSVYEAWLSANGRVPVLYHAKTDDLLNVLSHGGLLATHLPVNFFTAVSYLGLFLLPLLIPLFFNELKRTPRSVGPFFIGSALMSAGELLRIIYSKHALMPQAGNILFPSGIGPLTLRDEWILHLTHVPPLPVIFWLVITAAAMIGGALLIGMTWTCIRTWVARYARERRLDLTTAAAALSLVAGLVYLAPIVISTEPFDRYFVPAIPFFAAGLGGLARPADGALLIGNQALRYGAYGLVVVALLISIGTTRDYFTWNRVRWQALQDLTRDGSITRDQIDGGFEFNGLYFYDPAYQERANRSWWWVCGDTYLITFGPVVGYQIAGRYPYVRWLPWSTQTIYVLRKI